MWAVADNIVSRVECITWSCSLQLSCSLYLYWNVTAFLLQDNLRQNHFTLQYKQWESKYDEVRLRKHCAIHVLSLLGADFYTVSWPCYLPLSNTHKPWYLPFFRPCSPPSPRFFWIPFSSPYHSLTSRLWWCPSLGTLWRVIAHTLPQMLFPSAPQENPGSLSFLSRAHLALYSQPQPLYCKDFLSQPSRAFSRVPSSPSTLYRLCLPPPCSSSLQSWSRWVQWPQFFCGWFYIWHLKGLWHTVGSEEGVPNEQMSCQVRDRSRVLSAYLSRTSLLIY